jgi:hypothetical protein
MSIARKGLIAALLGAGLAVGASGALAQAQPQDRPGWYVGGAFGQADIGPDDDTAWKLFGGTSRSRSRIPTWAKSPSLA